MHRTWAPALFRNFALAIAELEKRGSAKKSESAERERKKNNYRFFLSVPCAALEARFQSPGSSFPAVLSR
jgi:hypothetical protein